MALTSKISVSLVAALTGTADLTTPSAPLSLTDTIRLASGTGSGQADRIFSDTRTIAASGNEDLDLAGVLADALGATLTFARIKVLYVAAAAGNTNNVVVSRPASNGVPIFSAASDAISVRPGGMLLWACSDATGVAVTAGTGDLINIANSSSGSSVTYDVVIIGASA
ncbi:hypothetical protein GCM10009557_05930 [Virgisporangium ochraceum]|uniref:Uncharacterized protein n=1 Tax=Virgisporangium ochraceum TaxID=65505 RepID=A0A8J4E8K1_9ACTN|nr:hypothetical protein [Virgisporangium ochraceum]GIJ66250.1 hypothetical protein Voc01_011670 [Virgisporangium ochraceum]